MHNLFLLGMESFKLVPRLPVFYFYFFYFLCGDNPWFDCQIQDHSYFNFKPFICYFACITFTVKLNLPKTNIIWLIGLSCPYAIFCHLVLITFVGTVDCFIGVSKASGTDISCTNILLEVSNMMKDICISMLSDDNFSEVISLYGRVPT